MKRRRGTACLLLVCGLALVGCQDDEPQAHSSDSNNSKADGGVDGGADIEEDRVGANTCADIDCAASSRVCEETANGAQCGRCLDGLLEDENTNTCREPRDCDDLNCPPGSDCTQTPGQDATCGDGCAGNDPPGIADGDGGCIPCPACDGPNEDGPYLEAALVKGNEKECICKPAKGYYYSLAPNVGIYPCDQDGDGWVDIAARTWLEHHDPVIRVNARCELRKVATFFLHNDAGSEPLEVTVPETTSMSPIPRKKSENSLPVINPAMPPKVSRNRKPSRNSTHSPASQTRANTRMNTTLNRGCSLKMRQPLMK